MQSLLNPTEKAAIVARLQQLTAESERQWGKMTVTQMLLHVYQPLIIGLGGKKRRQSLLGLLFGKTIKRRFLLGKPISKNLPTDPKFVITSTDDDFETALKQVLDAVEKVSNTTVDTENPHPFFGKMTADEWGKLWYAHFHHHLTQFGV
ncbi:MAG: DUF1569 domain-containing protein [Bacteroidetes bacterium]|nr:MAG: DUF1569 domain-containing protein [Bacteroidota bacterium]